MTDFPGSSIDSTLGMALLITFMVFNYGTNLSLFPSFAAAGALLVVGAMLSSTLRAGILLIVKSSIMGVRIGARLNSRGGGLETRIYFEESIDLS